MESAIRWFLVIAGSAVGLGVTAVYAPLSRRLSADAGLLSHVALLSLLLGAILVVAYAQPIAKLWREVYRYFPVRTVWLLVNVCLASCLSVCIGTEWGMVLVSCVAGWGLSWLALTSAPRYALAWSKFVRLSPLSFVAVGLLLLVGEGVLRANPSWVGGGGGGNPALRRLYRDLYHFNSWGLRGPEVNLPKPTGSFRVLALGDSFTFGQGVAEEATFPAQLQQLLCRCEGSPHVEVINAGQSGTDTADQLLRLQQFVERVQPDLVLVQFYLNDLQPAMEKTAGTMGLLVDRVLMWPAHQSYAIFFLHDRCKNLLSHWNAKPTSPPVNTEPPNTEPPNTGPPNTGPPAVTVGSPAPISQAASPASDDAPPEIPWIQALEQRLTDGDPGWQRFVEAVRGLKEFQQQHSVPMVAVLYPQPGAVDLPAVTAIHARVTATYRAADIPVIDLQHAFDSLPRTRQLVSSMDHHPSPEMHQLAARQVLQELAASRLLPAISEQCVNERGSAGGSEHHEDRQ